MSAACYLGTGKAMELAAMCKQLAADKVVLVGRPTASQRERLAQLVGCEIEVFDP